MGVKLGQKWAIKDGNLLASNQVGSRFFNKEFDFSRTTSGTYIDRDGVLQTAELYNLIPYSEDFTQWAITASGTTLSESLVISPDGQKHAYKLESDGSNLFARLTQSISLTNGNNVFYSIYVKQSGTHNDAYIRLDGTGIDGSQNNATYQFDFSTESISNRAGGDAVSTLVQDVGNGWYRIGIEVSNTTITLAQIYPAFNDANGGEILIFGAQLVEGTQRAYQYTNGLQGLPRISYENGVGHLLLEPQRSNLLLQSNSFDTSWTTSSSSITSGQSGVYGTNNAWLLEKSDTNGRVFQNISTSGVQTFSVYAKAAVNDWVFLLVNGGANPAAWFDLSTGSLGTAIGGIINHNISDVGNGWYKISITFDETISRVRIYVADADNDTSATSGSIYIQHAQLESGSYPTSIIETTTTSVTRNADVCNNSGSAQDFNSEEGVLYFEGAALTDGDINRNLTITAGAFDNIVVLRLTDQVGRMQGFLKSGGGTTYSLSVLGQDQTDNNKIALVYKASEFSMWLNGSKVSTASPTAMPIGLNTLAFDWVGSGNFYGKVKNLQVFTEALSFRELKELTGGVWGPYLLDNYTGAAAAYSLRQLNSDTTNVIRVRRSSDNAEQDFTAAEVSDGTLESWVNAEVVTYSTDFSVNDWSLRADAGSLEIVNGVLAFQGTASDLVYANKTLLQIGNDYKVTFRIRKTVEGSGFIQVWFGLNTVTIPNPTTEWQTVTVSGTCTSNNSLYIIFNNTSIGGEIDDLVLTQTTADGLVTTWYDQAGSNNVTQATASSQPKIVDSGVLVRQGGRASISFDGTDDVLTHSFASSISQPTYWFVTHNFHSTPAIYDGIIGNISGDPEHRLILNASLSYILQAGGSIAYNSYQTNQSLITYKIDSADERFYFNGTEENASSGVGIGSEVLESIVLGGLTQTTGQTPIKFQEIILYPSDQSSNREDIETNINDYYNIY